MFKMKKIIATLLAVAMMASIGTSVMASEVEEDYVADGMVLAGSYTEQTDDEVITKELWLPAPSNSRGFADTKYATVIHKIGPATHSDAIIITAYVSFQSQLGFETINVGATSFYASPKTNSLWYAGPASSFTEEKINNKKPWFGEMVAEYKLNYNYTASHPQYNTRTLNASCTVNGSMSDDGIYRSVAPNQVSVAGMTITF